jgi:hypothetical protein
MLEEDLRYGPFNPGGTLVSQNFSLHENYRDEQAASAGSDRAFGCTVGNILAAIGATKAFVAGAVPVITLLILGAGAVLLLLGIVARSRLSTLNKICLKIETAIAKLVNPIVLALLFFLVVTRWRSLYEWLGNDRRVSHPIGL